MALKSFVTATNAIFTVADNSSNVIGGANTQTVRIQGSTNLARGAFLDANIERIELSGNLNTYKFAVTTANGLQIQNISDNAVVATIPNINQSVQLVFLNGSATLVQSGATTFKLGDATAITVDAAAATLAPTLDATTSTVTLNSVTPPTNASHLVSKSFVTGANTIFTVADHDVKVLAGADSQTVRIQAGVTGVTLDANIERIELSAALATYKFLATAGIGLRIYEFNGTTLVATIPSINQAVKIAFTDGSATLAQTGAAAFTLGGQTVLGTAGTLLSATLATTTGERSVLGLHITNATTDVADAFSTYVPTSGTSGTAATVNATSMNQTKVGDLDTNVNKIATNGITGSIDITGEQFTTLTAKLDATTTLTVNADSGTARTATVLAAMNTKSTPNVNANIVTVVTGLAADIVAVTDEMGAGVGKINLSGLTTLEPSDAILADTFNNTTFTQTSVQITLANFANALTVATGTVASGNTLKVIGSALNATNALTFTGFSEEDGKYSVVGGAGSDAITGSANSDTIDGGAGSDTITAGAGSDAITGGADNDTIIMASNLAGAGAGSDTVDGGDGTDTLTMTGNTTTTQLDGVTNVEIITLGDAATTITTVTGLVASGASLKVDGGNITSANALTFNGSAETNGTFSVIGGAGSDAITGGADSDTIVGGAGSDTITAGAGSDAITGGADNDTIIMASNLAGAGAGSDTVDGGDGTDTLTMTGNTTTTQLDGVTNVEIITLGDAATTITTVTGLVASGASLKVDGGNITSANALTFNGSAETNGTFSVIGGAGSDAITGGADSDTIVGGAGSDTITAGAGSDAITGGADNDTIIMASNLAGAGAGSDTVDGGDGTDTLTMTGNTTTTQLDGVTNVEIITLGDAATTITTVTGLVASGASLKVDGGNITSANALTFNGSAETNGTFSVIGGAGSDAITGGADSDTIVGGAGSDTITAGAGSDAITGGADNDTIIMASNLAGAGAGSDTVDGGDGTDTLTMTGNTTTTQLDGVTNVEIITLGDAATTITTVTGLVASGASLKVDGGNITSANALTFNGSAETNGTFSVIGGAGSDTITGSSGNDTITGGAGSDSMTGGAGSDTFDVTDTSGVDTITDWGVGVDVLSGTYSGAGTLKVTISDLSATALDLTTALGSAGATASVTGGSGNDTITGGADSDVINGGAGSDSITGGAGIDTITGGAGSDTIDGGAGDDIIRIGSTGATIEIKNFTAGDDLVFFTGAILNLVIDSGDTDSIQDLIATDPVSGIDTTIHFTGIENTADTAWFNMGGSFTSTFAGSTITFEAVV